MNVHTLTAVVFCVLLLQTSAISQPTDPVSGSWISDAATLLELKYDGTRAVTGTAIWRGNDQVLRTPIKAARMTPRRGH
jgi:hypothetical protein